MIDQIADHRSRLSRDLCVRQEVETQWWYYHGHLLAGERWFGFHFVFFRRRTDRDRVGQFIPLRVVSPVYHVAHFSVTDIREQEFHWAHRRSVNGDSGASSDEYRIWLRDWSVLDRDGTHVVTAQSRNASLQLELIPSKPLVCHGREGRVEKAEDLSNYHVSFSRMDASGQLTYKNHVYEVSGTGWMDREFGTWEPCEQYRGWDWIAIQLEDGREMMVYMIRDSEHRPTGFSSLTLIESDGSQRVFPASEFSVQESEQWVSPYSGTTYPSRWRIRIPAVAAELEIQPVLACQELDTRGSSQVIYWEGAATAHGRIDGSAARGRAFVELVGYNRDHHNLSLLNFFANELRFRGRSREHTYRIQNCD